MAEIRVTTWRASINIISKTALVVDDCKKKLCVYKSKHMTTNKIIELFNNYCLTDDVNRINLIEYLNNNNIKLSISVKLLLKLI